MDFADKLDMMDDNCDIEGFPLENATKSMKRRVVINLDEELVKKIDSYAERMHINRTAAVSALLSSAVSKQFLTYPKK